MLASCRALDKGLIDHLDERSFRRKDQKIAHRGGVLKVEVRMFFTP